MAEPYIDIWDTAFGSRQTVVRVEYASDTIWYEGKALRGTPTARAAWMVRKITNDALGRMILREWAPFESIWDNRASLTYE